MGNDGLWLTLMLREKYNTDNEKNRICEELMFRTGKRADDIYTVSRNIDLALSYYVFIRLDDFEEKYSVMEATDGYFDISGSAVISGVELLELTKSVDQSRGYVKFGDVVLIKNGRYRKLYGVVLRRSGTDRFSVGIKLCAETVVEDYCENELLTTTNLFKYIKINN